MTTTVPIDIAVVATIVRHVVHMSSAKKDRPKGLLDLQWSQTVFGVAIVVRNFNSTHWAVGTADWKLSYRFVPLGEHEADLPLGGTIVHFGCKGHLVEATISGDSETCVRDLTSLRVMLPTIEAGLTTSQAVTFNREPV